MSCPHVATCPLFRLFSTKESLRVWRVHFCDGDFERCARLKLARAERSVPRNLLPNGKVLDLKLLDPKDFSP